MGVKGYEVKRPYAGAERRPQYSEKRSERLEFRLPYTQRIALERIAKEKRRTITSLIDEWLENLVKDNPCPKE